MIVSWIRPTVAIPMHYNTDPTVIADPVEFQKLVETLCQTEVVILDVGERLEC